MKREIRTITRVSFSGKWVEFWYEESPKKDTDSFDCCCKNYMFWNCIKTDKLYDDIITNGIKGHKMVWEKDDYNWHPISFVSDKPLVNV